MNKSKFVWQSWLLSVVVLWLVLVSAPVRGQDSAESSPSGDQTPAATSEAAPQDTASSDTDSAAADDQAAAEGETNVETPVGDSATPATEPAANDAPADAAEPSAAAPADAEPTAAGAGSAATDTPSASAANDSESRGLSSALVAVMVVAIIVVPVLAGNYLSKKWQMPDHGWKISTVLGTALAAIAVCATGEFKLGPDLGGGITLIYELAEGELVSLSEESPENPDEAEESTGRKKVDINKMVAALKQRVDPSGTKEVVIRPYGNAVEIIIPDATDAERQTIKNTITRLGELEFRITVDKQRANEPGVRNIIEAALALPASQKIVRLGQREVAEWVEYKVDLFGPLESEDSWGLVKRQGINGPEALVRIDDGLDVTGQYLTSALKGFGDKGWQVEFAFNSAGAARFEKLTGRNLPTAGSSREHHLGILLDKTLLSAPGIQARISNRGTISGGLTESEVEEVVAVLDAGSLPAALNPDPVSEEQISPTVGALTIQQATSAMLSSMVIVVLFMIFYYRFAGIVAVLALALNIVLVLGVMVMIGAAFTLPGLAGLVLTVGMSVDANVLIFERIREELKRGASLRMAIRNGFGRAFTTIVDANVTTLIVGLVLYAIGTDQIKGFAVTLILGIVMSMYSAIFCSRLVFDVAERRGWLKQLNMSKIIGSPNIDFLGKAQGLVAVSLVLIAIGLYASFSRGAGLFDIDFTGGTSVTLAFDSENPKSFGEVRKALEDSELGSQNLQVVQRGESGLSFTIDSSEQSVEAVQQILEKTFGDQLATYELKVEEVAPAQNDAASTTARLVFGQRGADITATSYEAVNAQLQQALEASGNKGVVPIISNPNYRPGSSQRFNVWDVTLGLDQATTQVVLDDMQKSLNSRPIFPLANKIGSRVAGDLQNTAISALLVSLLGIVGYIWFRFQKLSYGLAAVIALVHDVLIALGLVAISAWVANGAEGLARLLQIDAFQISLPIVAAFLTIIGYSLNDTIVIFDRIREVRGKSPRLSAEMVNNSISQTLSRTLITSLTTLIVVSILFWFGGSGVHGFAFTLLVGIIVGTYSSIFIASPALLWLDRLEAGEPQTVAKKAPSQAELSST
jgi:SecD/SecF fusion protein